MGNLVRCKACGYIMKADKVKDVCPACGVPAKAFEPYKDTISEKRRRLLELHLHPIIVHFPQAFASIIFFLLACGWFLPLPFKNELLVAALVLLYILPLSVIAAMTTGLIDGKTRFKSYTTQILTRKILTGIILLILSIIGTAVVFFGGINGSTIFWLMLVSIFSIACEVILGNLGSSIMESELPG